VLKKSSKGHRVKYSYKERSFAEVKERADRSGSRFDSPFLPKYERFTPKAGNNLIRILPPTWENHNHYALEVWMHRGIGVDKSSYICLRKMKNKKCPICEMERELRSAGENDEAKKIAPISRYLAWILNRDDEDSGPLIYDMSFTVDREVLNQAINRRSGSVLPIDNPDVGYDLTVNRQGTGLNTRYTGIQFDREPTSISDEADKWDEIMDFVNNNPLDSVLKFYDYDYLKNVVEGGGEEKDEDSDDEANEADDDQENSRSRHSTSSKRKPSSKDDDDEDGEEEPPFDTEDDDDEEDNDSEDVEEDDDEDEEEEEEERRPRKSSRPVERNRPRR
jgi:gp32 DNA binding protein like